MYVIRPAWHSVEGREDTAKGSTRLHWRLVLSPPLIAAQFAMASLDMASVKSRRPWCDFSIRQRAERQTQSPGSHFIWANLFPFTSSKRLWTRVVFRTPCVDGYRDDVEHFHKSKDYLIAGLTLNNVESIESGMPGAVSTNQAARTDLTHQVNNEWMLKYSQIKSSSGLSCAIGQFVWVYAWERLRTNGQLWNLCLCFFSMSGIHDQIKVWVDIETIKQP